MDRGRAGAPWIWVTWDVDQTSASRSTTSCRCCSKCRDSRAAAAAENEPRPYVFTNCSPRIRSIASTSAHWVDAMNYALTPAFLDERASFYEERARTLGVTDVAYQALIRKFFAERPAALRAMIAPVVQSPPMVRVHVWRTATRSRATATRSPTSGTASSSPARASACRSPPGGAARSARRVNGAEVVGTALDLRVGRDTTVDVE